MTSKKIPLFDLGNVVVKVDFEPFVRWLESHGADRSKAEAFSRSSLFVDFEFGAISRAEFAQRLSALFNARFSQAEAEAAFCNIFPGAVEGMTELLSELAQEGPIYALSNTNEVHLEWLWKNRPELMRPFTKIFASHEIRKRKPYPGIYQEVAGLLLVEPERLLFFDDLHANVAGALKVGVDAHVFSEAGQVRALLKRIEEKDDRS